MLFLEPVKNRREREILSDKATHLKKRKKPFILYCPWLFIKASDLTYFKQALGRD